MVKSEKQRSLRVAQHTIGFAVPKTTVDIEFYIDLISVSQSERTVKI